MKSGKIAVLLVFIFLLWTLLFVVQKPFFLLFYGGFSHLMPVMWHGLPLDFSMSGYLTALPALLILFGSLPFIHRQRLSKVITFATKAYFCLAAMCYSLAFVSNIALYGYWRFPLDSTPIFFVTSSPTAAMASVEWWQLLLGLLAIGLTSWGVYRLFMLLYRRFAWQETTSWRQSLLMLIFCVFLVLPIRGGVSVATMNTGQAYFSANQELNHAAVNPLFSFMESATHQTDFAKEYRLMDDRQAHKVFADYNKPLATDSTHLCLIRQATAQPDIYLIIMESFSDTIMHQPHVTPMLNRIKREGVWFSRFYANSFRTDRGLVSNLLGVPAPSTISLMKFPRKTSLMPSLAAQLVKHGYATHYYYGGDADFTNMRSFLINQRFMNLTEAHDFPVEDRLSKWGVPDHLLFQRVEKDLSASHSMRPTFRVIQTSSSHEPFDVPFHRLSDKKLNAFAYSDDCIGRFVEWLKKTDRWNRSLVVLIPDHLGAWPDDIDNFSFWRFHVPMLWTGGALSSTKKVVDIYGSQQDITASLLGQLGYDHSMFPFSKDLLDPKEPHYAFFMMNDGFGLIDDHGSMIYDFNRKAAVKSQGSSSLFEQRGKAITQVLFDYIARLRNS